MGERRVVVVGGGISGLAAAHELAGQEGITVTVCEAGERLGGKILTQAFAGVDLDLGPDAFLARRPEAVALAAELGLDHELVEPATTRAYVWVGGRLRPLPPGLVLGVPTRMGALARSGVLSPLGLARAAAEPLLPGHPLEGDEALGALVRRRLGTEVHRRLVDPLVGGINSGDSDHLSAEMVAPGLAAAARRHASLVVAARSVAAAASRGPVFLTLPGGLGRLVGALADQLLGAGVLIHTDAGVTGVGRGDERGYVVRLRAQTLEADAVVVATPAHAAAPLLAPSAPGVAATLAALEHASVTLVAMAFPAGAVARPLDGSGFLVARNEGRLMTACSWSSSKWAHVGASGQVLFRVSAGRAGDDRACVLDEGSLVDRLLLELGQALEIGSKPSEVRVVRWPNAFPQYRPGHAARLAAAEARLAACLPGVTLAGAALDGIGLPACIASGQAAARRILGSLSGRP